MSQESAPKTDLIGPRRVLQELMCYGKALNSLIQERELIQFVI